MADPTKTPVASKKDELSDDKLNTVTGGAIDAFLDFTDKGGTYPDKEKPPDTRK